LEPELAAHEEICEDADVGLRRPVCRFSSRALAQHRRRAAWRMEQNSG
jgi:hypothetical protein